MSSVIRIYSLPKFPRRLSIWGRLLAALVAVGAAALLAVAAGLSPSPAGVGTHRQLGMRPCSLYQRTHIPCPTCGMTTSFAFFADARPWRSFVNQPMGFVLALGATMSVWGGLYVAATGRPVWRMMGSRMSPRAVMAVGAMVILAWAWKIAMVVSSGAP